MAGYAAPKAGLGRSVGQFIIAKIIAGTSTNGTRLAKKHNYPYLCYKLFIACGVLMFVDKMTRYSLDPENASKCK